MKRRKDGVTSTFDSCQLKHLALPLWKKLKAQNRLKAQGARRKVDKDKGEKLIAHGWWLVAHGWWLRRDHEDRKEGKKDKGEKLVAGSWWLEDNHGSTSQYKAKAATYENTKTGKRIIIAASSWLMAMAGTWSRRQERKEEG
jgi:hypothetical protein